MKTSSAAIFRPSKFGASSDKVEQMSTALSSRMHRVLKGLTPMDGGQSKNGESTAIVGAAVDAHSAIESMARVSSIADSPDVPHDVRKKGV